MLSKFFIHRPIFAGVLAIIVMAFGLFATFQLPVERYPDIAPPRITVSATYTGASAETVEESVTQVLEQQIKGIDHLLYFSSSSDSNGRSRISISFENGTDPDTAQVQVQNAINGVINRLPEDVQRQGVNVYKSLGDTHMVIGLYDQTGKSSNIALSDYMMTHLEQDLARIDGVGEVDVFGAQYAMRLWLNPHKLRQYGLMPSDIYFQIALLTTIGLSCKNAILIVEFASLAQQKGQTAIEAALEGASLRLRPILMTSLAFGAGVTPLVFAFGAGAASRQEIGVSVLGGVIFGTVLVLLFIPLMYVLVRRVFHGRTPQDKV
jgi:multidrug efflux pump subunit AcrB